MLPYILALWRQIQVLVNTDLRPTLPLLFMRRKKNSWKFNNPLKENEECWYMYTKFVKLIWLRTRFAIFQFIYVITAMELNKGQMMGTGTFTFIHRAFFSEKSRPLTACHPMERHLTDDYWHSTWSVAAHFTWIESELSGTVFEVLSFRTHYINITRKSPINRNILSYDNKTIYSIFNHLFLIQRTL